MLLRPATVLLVDDDKAIRGLVRRILSEEGYQILEAGDGIEALELGRVHTEPIDLLLTDVIMHGLNGFALAKQLMQIRTNVAILYMSGYGSDHTFCERSSSGSVAEAVQFGAAPECFPKLAQLSIA